MINSFLQAAIIVNLLTAVIRISTPLLLAAIGEMITENSGIMNLGVEGTMLTAAFIGFLVTKQTNSLLNGIIMAVVAGALTSLLFGFFTITLQVDQTITGLAINLLASGLTFFLFRSIYKQTTSSDVPLITKLPSAQLPILSKIPYLGEILFSHNFLTYLAFSWINSRRGSTASPIRIENNLSASAASSMVTFISLRVSGFIVVSHNC